jgi:hypothetical protein
MLHSIWPKVVKAVVLAVCLGVVSSACWVRGPDRRGYHEDRHDYRR